MQSEPPGTRTISGMGDACASMLAATMEQFLLLGMAKGAHASFVSTIRSMGRPTHTDAYATWVPIPSGGQNAQLWEAQRVQEPRCPECGEEFEVVWGVSIAAHADDYTPVFGGPVVIDYARCAT